MTKTNLEVLNETLADAVMSRPREFFIGKKRHCLWSPSLGMSLMIGRHMEKLGIDTRMLSDNPSLEVMRLISKRKDDVCYILAILSYRSFVELSNTDILRRRARQYAKDLSDDDMATLLLLALGEHDASWLIKEAAIDKEHAEQSRIAAVKNKDGHTRIFGGKTMYGSLIDAACKAYGWTKEYVVWGIDLVSLRMMLADSVNTLYLSDDDMKELNIYGNDVLDAGDPANSEEIMKNWK